MIYFHTSNPKSRAAIAVEGLVPQVGECYSSHYEDDDTPAEALRPAVFLAFGQDNIFDSTWDDDLWEIDAEGLALDREEEGLDWFLCFDPILPPRLRLVYEGTGGDKLNLKGSTPWPSAPPHHRDPIPAAQRPTVHIRPVHTSPTLRSRPGGPAREQPGATGRRSACGPRR